MIGLSSSVYAMKGFSIYDSIEKIRELGFELAEIGAAHNYEKDAFAIIKKVMKDFGDLKFTVHAYFPPFKMDEVVNFSLGLTKVNRKVVDNLFKTAEMTEASIISFHPGFMYERMVFTRGEDRGYKKIEPIGALKRKDAVRKNYGIISYIINKNKDLGVKACFENIPSVVKPVFLTLKDFEELFDKFSELCFLYDVGHAMQSMKDGYALLKLGDRIAEIHLHDWNGKIDHLILNEGKVDWRRVLSIKNIRRTAVVFEHGKNVSEEAILKEKALVERHLG